MESTKKTCCKGLHSFGQGVIGDLLRYAKDEGFIISMENITRKSTAVKNVGWHKKGFPVKMC